MRRIVKDLCILDFDIENRPLSYLGGGFTTSDITAIAWSWAGRGVVTSRLLGWVSQAVMLEDFRVAYNAADIVTGHYIRRHDLPIINGAMLELGLAPLGPKRTIDTKLDLVRLSGVSKSQESLAAMCGISAPKVTMTQADWREANRLTDKGIRLTKERVEGDVVQHKALRMALAERGLLKPSSIWRPAP